MQNGRSLPTLCNFCDEKLGPLTGGPHHFTARCTNPECNEQLHLFASTSAPDLLAWECEAPHGTKFLDFVRQKRAGTRASEYPALDPAAAPGS